MSILLKIKAGVPQTMGADDNPTYEEWLARVDGILTRQRGISLYDLPDCLTRDWYEDRVRPIRAANRALRNAGACGY